MAIAFVQQKTNSSTSSSTVVVTLDAAPTAGNCLVAVIATKNQAVSSISGGGVTWVLGKQQTTTGFCEIWYGLNSTGVGTAITITLGGKGDNSANISEYSGVVTASAIDVTGGGSATSTAPATGDIITTNAEDLLIAGACVLAAGAPSAGPTNSFNALTFVDNAANADLISAYRIVSSTGTYSTDWTIGSSVAWNAAIISLKAAASAGGPHGESYIIITS